jgi:hypothetical protein
VCGDVDNEEDLENETWIKSDLEAFQRKLQCAHDAACVREREKRNEMKRKVPRHYKGNSVQSRQVRAKKRKEFVAAGGVLITDFFGKAAPKMTGSESELDEDVVRDKSYPPVCTYYMHVGKCGRCRSSKFKSKFMSTSKSKSKSTFEPESMSKSKP